MKGNLCMELLHAMNKFVIKNMNFVLSCFRLVEVRIIRD